MSYRSVVSLVAAAVFGIACISTDAMAFRGRVGGAGFHGGYRGGAYRGGAYRGGAYRGGAYAYRGGAYRGGYWRPGAVAAGAAVGAAALGAAAASPYYYNYNSGGGYCGYAPYPPCY
jgi:hypothetical protein